MIEIYQQDGSTANVATLDEALKHYENFRDFLTIVTWENVEEIISRLPIFDDHKRANFSLVPPKELEAQAAKAVYRWRQMSPNRYKPLDIDNITKMVYNLLRDSVSESTCQFYGVQSCGRSLSYMTIIKRVSELYKEKLEFANHMVDVTNEKISNVGKTVGPDTAET